MAEIERLGSILQKLHGQMAGKFNEVSVAYSSNIMISSLSMLG